MDSYITTASIMAFATKTDVCSRYFKQTMNLFINQAGESGA
jgi:hypothetical protein